MQTVVRLIMLLAGGLLMVTALFVFQRILNGAVQDRQYKFTEAEIAEGKHCKEQYQHSEVGLVSALKERMGDNLDDRIKLAIRDIDLGPLRSDGTHRLVVTYNIVRIGETVGPAKLARGQIVNADCSVNIAVFQN